MYLDLQDRGGSFFLGGSFVSYVGRNMLSYPIPQSLVCVSYIAKITFARKFLNKRTILVGRNAILLNGWKGSPSAVNNTGIDGKETFCNGLFYLACKSQGIFTNLW